MRGKQEYAGCTGIGKESTERDFFALLALQSVQSVVY